MLAPLYEYNAEGPYRCQYTSNPNLGFGWTKGGIAFYAYEEQQSDTVPIYGYYAENPYRYLYSRNPNLGFGWTKVGIAFYAHKEQQSGTLPIYQYHAEKPYRGLYSSNPNLGFGWTKGEVAFYAVPGEIQWKYTFDSITYNESLRPPTQQDLVHEKTIRNKSTKSEIQQTVTFSTTKSSTFEWGLTQTLSVGSKLGFEAGVPFGEVSGEFSIELDLGAHQTWTETQQKEIIFEEKVTVPAGDSVSVKGFVDFAENVVTPFKLKVRISAKSGNAILRGNQIGQIFKQMNPDATIENTLNDKIIASLRGEFFGSYAIDTSTEVESL